MAAEKIVPLIHAGAHVHLVSPEISVEMAPFLAEVWLYDRRTVRPADVIGAGVVVAATGDADVNRRLSETARTEGILVNVADDPEHCDYYSPAIIRRGPVMVTISTDGGSPLLAGQLRRLLEAALPRSLARVSDLLVRLRRRGLRGLQKRSDLLRALADPKITRFVDTGDTEAAADRLEQLYRRGEEPFDPGTVAIVGAGPGSRELLTLRALDRIQRADVILHDALVGREVLDLALPGTRIIDVGRRSRGVRPLKLGLSSSRRRSHVTAIRIDLMIREAKAGNRVTRLHGGDPFVFGCGGEEVDALAEAGIPVDMVPGVSSVLAAPAAAGIPLTRRGVARGFTVRVGRDTSGPTRGELTPEEETVVVLMGLASVHDVMEGLLAEGRSPDTPAVAVSCASRAEERIVVGTLGTLGERVRAAKLESPATLIVGRVAHRVVREGNADSKWPEHERHRVLHPTEAAG